MYDASEPERPVAKEFETRALAALRSGGFRITGPRLQVIRILAGSRKALGAADIFNQITERGDQIDMVSVYRILTTLSDLHLVHHIGVAGGYIACDLGSHGQESEHVVCQSCGNVLETAMPEEAVEATKEQLKKLGFTASSIKLEVEGECRKCSEN